MQLGIADKIEIQIAYAICISNPVSISINTFGTGKYRDEFAIKLVNKVFKLAPLSIINQLGLRNLIYKQLVSYGHFGRLDLPWERLDKVKEIKKVISYML